MATDQEIRDRGILYMPQQRYLQNPYNLPVAPDPVAPVPGGITNTNAFNNGGSDFSVYNPDPNSIVNRNYNPYPFRQAESPIDEGSDPSYFNPTPSKLEGLASQAINFTPFGPLKKGLEFLGDYIPPNRRKIMENQLSGQGVMVNDIGQIVQGGGAYDTAANVMAGYNPTKMTAETFDKRLGKIKETMNKDGYKGDLQKRYDAIVAAKQDFLDAEDESDLVYGNQVTQKKIRKDKNFLSRIFKKKKAPSDGDGEAANKAAAANRAGQIAAEKGANTTTSSGGRGSRRGAADIRESSRGKNETDDTADFFARGGRAGYFFGGRVNYKQGGRVSFKNGGLASIL